MLLGEPPRTPYDLNFLLFGIPVRVHPLFWLVTLLLGSQQNDVAAVLTWVIAVFFSILVHEFGHALAMRAYRFRPWIVLYGLGGLTGHDQKYGSDSRGAAPLGQVLISAAGPAAGFLLAALLVLGLTLAGLGGSLEFFGPGRLKIIPQVWLPNVRIGALLNDIFFICTLWGVVNLLPVYPLDGGHIAREVLLKLSPRQGIRLSLLLSMIAAGAMAAFGILQWHDIFVGVFFGYLAYSSYATLAAYSGRNPW